nr:hypothetical protein CFP56_47315 [Quercus suber]
MLPRRQLSLSSPLSPRAGQGGSRPKNKNKGKETKGLEAASKVKDAVLEVKDAAPKAKEADPKATDLPIS